MIGYLDNIGPAEAWKLLAEERESVLIDVRTFAEWSYVGIPDLSNLGKKPILLEWQSYPNNELNPDFTKDLVGAVANREASVIFLCRSGARSASAASSAAGQGYSHCYNLAGGFEGDPDSSQHRGLLSGWKAAGLPWVQS